MSYRYLVLQEKNKLFNICKKRLLINTDLGFSSFQSLDSWHFVQDLMVDGGEGSPKHPIHSVLGVIGRMLCVELVELVSQGVRKNIIIMVFVEVHKVGSTKVSLQGGVQVQSSKDEADT